MQAVKSNEKVWSFVTSPDENKTKARHNRRSAHIRRNNLLQYRGEADWSTAELQPTRVWTAI